MSSIPLSPDQRAQRWGTAAKWLAFVVVGFLFAPFAIATITGMLGLIVAGAIAGATWFALPVIESMAVNLRLKMIKAEAAKNPIETLQAEYQRQSLLLDERKDAIETFDAKIRTFADKLDGFKRNYPAEAPKYQAIYDQMSDLLRRRNEQWKQGKHQLALFDQAITKATAIWEMSNAANAARAGSGLDDEAFWAKIKTETAFDSIQENMNRSLSELDTLTLESDSIALVPGDVPAAALPAPDSRAIDVSSVAISAKTHR